MKGSTKLLLAITIALWIVFIIRLFHLDYPFFASEGIHWEQIVMGCIFFINMFFLMWFSEDYSDSLENYYFQYMLKEIKNQPVTVFLTLPLNIIFIGVSVVLYLADKYLTD